MLCKDLTQMPHLTHLAEFRYYTLYWMIWTLYYIISSRKVKMCRIRFFIYLSIEEKFKFSLPTIWKSKQKLTLNSLFFFFYSTFGTFKEKSQIVFYLQLNVKDCIWKYEFTSGTLEKTDNLNLIIEWNWF